MFMRLRAGPSRELDLPHARIVYRTRKLVCCVYEGRRGKILLVICAATAIFYRDVAVQHVSAASLGQRQAWESALKIEILLRF
jgi:hypothetical protein